MYRNYFRFYSDFKVVIIVICMNGKLFLFVHVYEYLDLFCFGIHTILFPPSTESQLLDGE